MRARALPIRSASSLLAVLLTLVVASPGRAVDGAIEVNQIKALVGGVLLGDVPGFPVTITEPGTYRLTGNLDISVSNPQPENTRAFQVEVDDVTIDLNGFSIVGSTTCTGSPPSCDPLGSGAGVGAAFGGGRRVRVSNGTIRGMGGLGIELGNDAQIDRVLVQSNGSGGILVGDGSAVTDSSATDNGGHGIVTGAQSIVRGSRALHNRLTGIQVGNASTLTGNSASNNGGLGISLGGPRTAFGHNVMTGNDQSVSMGSLGGTATGGNVCDDRLCSGTGARKFYITIGDFTGSQVSLPGVCEQGYHVASILELSTPSALLYERSLGRASADEASGVPGNEWGWVWTGKGAGFNCQQFQVSDPGEFGESLKLDSETVTGLQHGFVQLLLVPCNLDLPAWCVQD